MTRYFPCWRAPSWKAISDPGVGKPGWTNFPKGVMRSIATHISTPSFLGQCILPAGNTASHNDYWFKRYTMFCRIASPSLPLSSACKKAVLPFYWVRSYDYRENILKTLINTVIWDYIQKKSKLGTKTYQFCSKLIKLSRSCRLASWLLWKIGPAWVLASLIIAPGMAQELILTDIR